MTIDEARPVNKQELKLQLEKFANYADFAGEVGLPVHRLHSIQRTGYVSKNTYNKIKDYGEFILTESDRIERVDNTELMEHNKKEISKFLKRYKSFKTAARFTGVAAETLIRIKIKGFVSMPVYEKLKRYCELKPVTSKRSPIVAEIEFDDIESVRAENEKHPIKDEFLIYMLDGILRRGKTLKPLEKRTS